MSSKTGGRLGLYELLASLGAGGMGEVYRARDTKLDREVAIKRLLEEVADDPDRLARFEREAKVLASLNHDNVATLFGFESDGDEHFLVMELVEGETLAERIERGPLPVSEALELFRQIAEGLEAAHRSGVIHRDLKPANIKISPDEATDFGRVKILDFGLARALASDEPEIAAENQSLSPTLTLGATMRGEILGTAAYMSPEQARGKPVDERTDLWAFGACLWEALSGRRLFAARDATETLAFVLTKEPDWLELPSDVPAGVRRILRRCLERNPRQRFQHAGDLRFEIEEALAVRAQTTVKPAPPPRARSTALTAALFAATAVVAATVGWFAKPEREPPPSAPLHAVVSSSPHPVPHTTSSRRNVAITPDGTTVIYRILEGDDAPLYVRTLDSLEGRVLVDGVRAHMPFVSPDGEWVGFWDARDETLKRVPIDGGEALTVCRAPFPYGAAWTSEGVIVVSGGRAGLSTVPASGGTLEPLTTVDEEQEESAHMGARLLPDGRVLFTLSRRGPRNRELVVVDPDSGIRKSVRANALNGHYLETGHLVFETYDLGDPKRLWAVRFDLETLEARGNPVPVLEGVHIKLRGTGDFAFSDTGRLVYITDVAPFEEKHVTWVDRDGTEVPLPTPTRNYFYPRISPDGRSVAFEVREPGSELWIWELERETLTRLTFGDEVADGYPVWTPDSERIVFTSGRSGAPALWSKPADGSGEATLFHQIPNLLPADRDFSDIAATAFLRGHAFTPDASQFVFFQRRPAVGSNDDNLRVLHVEGEARAEPLLEGAFDERNPELSPDGRWLAYQSDESGQFEVFVRPFPDVEGGRWKISTAGGEKPLWSRNGRELFYRQDQALMAVAIDTATEFTPGPPELLFDGAYHTESQGRNYDVSPDGQRFLMIRESAVGEERRADVVVVENWFAEIERLLPND